MLRGGVSTESISTEFNQLKNITQMSASCASCEKAAIKCDHPPPTLFDKFKDMTRKRTLKPFILVTFLFLFMQFCGIFVMRPYIVPILSAHGILLDANFVTIILGVLGILANIFIVFFIRLMGKRRIYLYSTFLNFICCFGLSKIYDLRGKKIYSFQIFRHFTHPLQAFTVGYSSPPLGIQLISSKMAQSWRQYEQMLEVTTILHSPCF